MVCEGDCLDCFVLCLFGVVGGGDYFDVVVLVDYGVDGGYDAFVGFVDLDCLWFGGVGGDFVCGLCGLYVVLDGLEDWIYVHWIVWFILLSSCGSDRGMVWVVLCACSFGLMVVVFSLMLLL